MTIFDTFYEIVICVFELDLITFDSGEIEGHLRVVEDVDVVILGDIEK